METSRPAEGPAHLKAASGRIARRVLVICENRAQLLLVEVQEERERILRAIWLGTAAAVFGLLAGFALTILLAIACWNYSPVMVLMVLALIYAAAVIFFFTRLMRLQRGWQTLPATIDQLKKDRECLERQLE